MKTIFKLKSKFQPAGDQPCAIEALQKNENKKRLLLGVTGSGKTFTLANLIAKQNRQVLILSPNKTLAAQLYEEFSTFFPENQVCYFVSYFDYYQPESYVPSTDTYISKETKTNAEIERLRVEATASLINRPDTIIIASVSAIYSLGNPFDYKKMAFAIKINQKISRAEFLEKLVNIQYERNDANLESGKFRAIGNQITLDLPYLINNLIIEIEDEKVVRLDLVDKKNFSRVGPVDNVVIFPAKHFVTPKERVESGIEKIKKDLEEKLKTIDNPVIKTRLRTRINHDISMLQTTGYCSGIENYSAYFDNRDENLRPFCLFDFFEKDFLLILDESHIAIPQLSAMYKGDRSRKQNLVDYGFRLPSALENRPLKFEEIEEFFTNTVFVSATPSDYELEKKAVLAEQIVRPTGIIDPEIFVRPRENQLDNLLEEIKKTSAKNFRTLITVLTKKSAEDLALFLEKKKIKVCYLHSEIKTPERTKLLNKLRTGEFEALVGINLLREGLDLPEVALVAIIDADIEGFLRNTKSLIQTVGRAARNTQSKVIFYADKMTDSIKQAIKETNRRRKIQKEYNQKHKINPKNVSREVVKSITKLSKIQQESENKASKPRRGTQEHKNLSINELKKKMMQAAHKRNFKKAIELREMIKKLEKK